MSDATSSPVTVAVPVVVSGRWIVSVEAHAPTREVVWREHYEDADAPGAESSHRAIAMEPAHARALSLALAQAADAAEVLAPDATAGSAP